MGLDLAVKARTLVVAQKKLDTAVAEVAAGLCRRGLVDG